MTYRMRTILIAVALALLAAILVSIYATSYQNRVDKKVESVEVYVAGRDIPAGTAAEDLVKNGYVTKATVLRKNVVPGAVAQPDQLPGLAAGASGGGFGWPGTSSSCWRARCGPVITSTSWPISSCPANRIFTRHGSCCAISRCSGRRKARRPTSSWAARPQNPR